MTEEKNPMDEQYEELATEDLVYGNHHALNTLLDILIEKGIISEQEFKDKLDAVIEESESVEDVKIDQ
ncbi:hypothetical protein KO361_01015 [Candidatus Woesearchaeota archaeon]|nr:hypothetical protein [Candidatus Woesearchaeota archaeon]